MEKLSLTTIALLTLLTLPKAHGGTLLCKKAETGEFFSVIFENSPSKELAVMVSKNGGRSTLEFNQKTEMTAGACMNRVKTTKVISHPFYHFELEGIESYGREFTRCAGLHYGGHHLTGTFHAEMQSPTPLTCDEVSTAEEKMNTSGVAPTAAAACCSWSEGTLIPGCMPGC